MATLVRTENIVLEIDGESPFRQIVAQQGDENTLVVKILLLYKKQKYMIPEGIIPRIKYIKPDGYQVLNNCDIDDEGNVLVTYTEQMLSAVGTGKGQLLFIAEGEELKTPLFFTKIYPAAYGKEIPESSPEYKTFNQLLEDCDEKIKEAQEYASASGEYASAASGYATTSGEYASASQNSADLAKEYYEKMTGEYVTGVKGELEEAYQTDKVIITAKSIGALKTDGDSGDNMVSFESEDASDSEQWSDVELLSSGEKHSSIFKKISTMFKNIRYLYKLLGTTDISGIGDGTATGAISELDTKLTQKILWGNPSPNAIFEPQEISIDLTNYQAIEVEFIRWKTEKNFYKIEKMLVANDARTHVTIIYGGKITVRAFQIKDSLNAVYFYDASIYETYPNATVNNDYCIPQKIIGIPK